MKRPAFWALLAASTYALAWFLPVYADYSPPSGRIPGWDAFLVALQPEGNGPLGGALSIASALTNFVMLSGLVLLARSASHRVPRWAVVAMGSAALLNQVWWAWPSEDPTSLRSGYWLWMATFWLVALLLLFQSRRRRAAA